MMIIISGDIRLKSALSFGVKNSYRLEVEAKDGAAKPRSGTAYVLISVQDTNDLRQYFHQLHTVQGCQRTLQLVSLLTIFSK